MTRERAPMKVTEFEEKLATVSDSKLRQMLSAGRANGPEIAVKLILAEGKRRGMDDLEALGMLAELRAAGSATSAYSHEHSGFGGSDAPPAFGAGPFAGEDANNAQPGSEVSSTPPDWLNEETKSGMPVAVKVVLVVVVVGLILGVAWKFSH